MWNEYTHRLVIQHKKVIQLYIITRSVELNCNCLRLCLILKVIVFDLHCSQYQQTFAPSSGILYYLLGYGIVYQLTMCTRTLSVEGISLCLTR